MAKNWVKIETINDISKENITEREKIRRENSFNVLIKNTKSLPIKELKKRSKELYLAEKAKEDNLLEAFKEKKLKSKELIKQALRLRKERVAMAESAKAAKQNKEDISKKKEEITEKAV